MPRSSAASWRWRVQERDVGESLAPCQVTDSLVDRGGPRPVPQVPKAHRQQRTTRTLFGFSSYSSKADPLRFRVVSLRGTARERTGKPFAYATVLKPPRSFLAARGGAPRSGRSGPGSCSRRGTMCAQRDDGTMPDFAGESSPPWRSSDAASSHLRARRAWSGTFGCVGVNDCPRRFKLDRLLVRGQRLLQAAQ